MSIVCHITTRAAWDAARKDGSYAAPSLETEGFIHLSVSEQVAGTLRRFYKNQTGLVLLTVDANKLTAPLRFDDVPEHGTFPHLYGPLNLDAVTDVAPLETVRDAG